jgi:zinc transporter, ZIP family
VVLADIALPLFLTFLAGLSTLLGGLIVLVVRKPSNTFLAFTLGASAGVMIYISFVELLQQSIEDVGFIQANLAFLLGIGAIFAIDSLVPHRFMNEGHDQQAPGQSQLFRTGTLVALGLAVHNFPEGMIVFLSALQSIELGAVIALAVAIHNIPEGIAVAMPIYHATGNKAKAVAYAGFSGMAEPVGALVGALILLPWLTEELMGYVLAFVAGIMIFISLDELLPTAHRYGAEHWVIMGIVAGMSSWPQV